MIRVIAAKEFLTSVLTYRFALAIAASVLFLSLSAFLLRADYAKRLDDHQAELADIESDMEEVGYYAHLEVAVSRPPSPLSVFSEGVERRMGTVLRFSYASVPTMLTWKKETNPLLAAFPPFDLATIAQLLFSLMALILAFDGITGEREGNTLKCVAANRVARWQILLGKWLGGSTCALLAAACGFLLATLILVNSPHVSLTGAEQLRVALIFVAIALYVSAFYLVGLAISAHCRGSGTSLVACMAVWVGCTVVGPTTVSYLVGELYALPSARQLDAQRNERLRVFRSEWSKRLSALEEDFERRRPEGEPYGFGLMTSYQSSPLGTVMVLHDLYLEAVPLLTAFYGEFEPRRIQCGEDIAEIEDRLVQARVDQARMARSLGRLFVAPALGSAVSALAASDLASFQGFVSTARRHRRDLADWMRDRGMFTSVLFFSSIPEEQLLTRAATNRRQQQAGHGRSPFSEDRSTVDRSDLPRYPDYRAGEGGSLRGAAVDLGVLLAANPLAFFLGLLAFARRELG